MAGPGEHLCLAFTGDICLSLGVHESAASAPLFGDVASALGRADVLIGNLEGPLFDVGSGDAVYREVAPTVMAQMLSHAGFDVVCLANNHVMDAGREGLQSTLAALDAASIRHFGAGTDLEAATRMLVVERRGVRVGFLGYCDFSMHFAGRDKAGIAPLVPRRVLRRVREVRHDVDLLVVVLHADLEFTGYPATWRVRLARRLAREGAHMVIQHHPHVLQGIEKQDAGIIAYSLGNFVFGVRADEYQAGRTGVEEAAVLLVSATRWGREPALEWSTTPVTLNERGAPVVADGANANRIAKRLDLLSRELADLRTIRRAWARRCRTEAKERVLALYYRMRRRGLASALHLLWRNFRVRENHRWMVGLLSRGFR